MENIKNCYCEGFIKLHQVTVIPLISAPGAYLILKLKGVTVIGERCLKEGGAFFKVK